MRARTAIALGAIATALVVTALMARRRRRAPVEVTPRGDPLRTAPGMEQDIGWVHLLTKDDRSLGRGRLMVYRGSSYGTSALRTPAGPASAHGQLVPGEGPWEGRVDPLRLEGEAAGLTPGRYRLRFEQSTEQLLVDVLQWTELDTSRGHAEVRSADGQVPSVLLELGGD